MKRSDIVKEVDLHCRRCRVNLMVTYSVSGNPDIEVFTGYTIKCHRCKRAIVMKKYTEKMFLDKADCDGKLFI